MSLRFERITPPTPSGPAWHGMAGRSSLRHVSTALALWDVWTSIAGPPVAFEPPSAAFALDWNALWAMRSRGVAFATLTHAAGISSTGDTQLDQRLPFDEPYVIPPATAEAISRVRACGGRVVAIGTTVVRALEHAAARDGRVRGGEGLATQRIGATTRLRVVDAILSGMHEPGTSHYELLRAFTDDVTLGRACAQMTARDYRTHEFGDSVLIEQKSTFDERSRPGWLRDRLFAIPQPDYDQKNCDLRRSKSVKRVRSHHQDEPRHDATRRYRATGRRV